jgi:hypothetical protein
MASTALLPLHKPSACFFKIPCIDLAHIRSVAGIGGYRTTFWELHMTIRAERAGHISELELDGAMTQERLARETLAYRGSGGTSEESRGLGFRPAFLDLETDIVYPSCFADGRPAPFHLLDGLPGEIVLSRDAAGRVLVVKPDVVAGFLRGGRFYTRAEAAEYSQSEVRAERARAPICVNA